MEKQRIIDEIRRTAVDGKPLGRSQFLVQTGIKESDWLGKYWARWSEAQAEAGFDPLSFGENAFEDDHVLRCVVELTRKLGRLPTTPEMRLEKRKNSLFPNDKTISRRGNRSVLFKKLIEFCGKNPQYHDVESILRSQPATMETISENLDLETSSQDGYVYLISAQAAYKIGCTRAPYRRAAEIANQSAKGAELLHLISTDDPVGIEKYWHGRFSEKRLAGVNKQSGEWFALTFEDVKTFKRRKFM
jgi:hypothetical protein